MITQWESERRLCSPTLSYVLAGVVLALPLLTGPPVAGQSQPNYLKFGSVRVGATVEGSVRIFREGEDARGLAIKVEPPAFVRIRDIEVGTQTSGPDARGFCDISLSLDTGRAGDYSGEVRVEIGHQRIAVPVSVTVRPQELKLTRVLIVETPFEKFSTGDATDFAPWLNLVRGADLDVHYLDTKPGMPVLREIDLAKFDVLLLGMGGLVRLLDSDIARLKRFVERGGRAILAANAFFVGTVGKANELLVPYGLRMTDTESRDQQEFDLGGAEIGDDPLTRGVKALYFHRPSPVAVTDSGKAKVLVAAPAYPGEGFVAVARAGRGEVVALGESLWWHWIAPDKAGSRDNAVLLANLLKRSGQ